MDQVDVCVVVPTYNRRDYLPSTIRSILAQTVAPREIIVVDNGEQDATEALTPFGSRVRLIRQAPGGVQRARNAGIEAASSTWIATLDDDDLYHPDFMACVRPAIEDARVDIVFTDHRKFEGQRSDPRTKFSSAPRGYWTGVPGPAPGQNWSFVGRFPLERLLFAVAGYPSTMLFRKAFAERIGGYDPRVRGIPAEDLEFSVRALHRGSLAIVWKALVDYRVHAANTAGGADRQRIGRWRIFEFVRQHGRDLPPNFLAALEANLLARRRDIFDFAFHKGLFEVAAEAGALLSPQDWTARRRIYRVLLNAPAYLRGPLSPMVSLPRRAAGLLLRPRRKTMPGLTREAQKARETMLLSS